MIERQELHCHQCNQYVQFDVDTEMNGNHVLKCPVCGHEHCRVVTDGRITADRWDQRNRYAVPILATNVTYSSSSTWNSTSTTYTSGYGYNGNGFLYQSWMTSSSST